MASLNTEIAPERATPQAIAKALKASVSWGETPAEVAGSWFEESDEAMPFSRKANSPRQTQPRRRCLRRCKSAVLVGHVDRLDRFYDETFAGCIRLGGLRTAARELLGDRPLDEFGIMNGIAEATIANCSGRR